jgi:hypothetical protein
MASNVRRYTYTANTDPGGQHIINLDTFQNPYRVGIVVDVVSGLASYAVEFTTDELDKEPPYRWWSDSALPSGQTASQNFTLDNSAVTGTRLNLTTITGEIRFSVNQGFGN